MITYPKLLQISPYVFLTKNDCGQIETISLLDDTRVVVDHTSLKIMQYCQEEKQIEDLKRNFSWENILFLMKKSILVDPEHIWTITNIEYIDIEINTNCNRRCEFCPQHISPLPVKYMSMELFNDIIDKAEKHSSIKYVVLNFYNEPTLDKYFSDRIKKISQTRLKLFFHTNGSAMDKDKIILFKKHSDMIHSIRINLPSLERDEFIRLTGTNAFIYERTIKNIDMAIDMGLKIELVVDGNNRERQKNIPSIMKKYGALVNVLPTDVGDRAGTLKNRYYQGIHIKSQLFGCIQVLKWLRVGVEGECMMCCEDYHKKENFGTIIGHEIKDVLCSKTAQDMRKKVFGVIRSADHFLCRHCFYMKVSQIYKNNLNSLIRYSELQ